MQSHSHGGDPRGCGHTRRAVAARTTDEAAQPARTDGPKFPADEMRIQVEYDADVAGAAEAILALLWPSRAA
jgi:hypothetical protein